MTMSMFLRLYRAPVWRCILATLVAVPFSYFGVLFAMTPGQGVANPAAAAAYFFICIVLALPLALANALVIAPCVVKTVRGRFSAVGSHLILAAAWAGLVFVGYFAAPRLPAALDWVMLFWYLASFLGPAVIAGSFVYSLKYDSTGSK
jgi:hypothetical protein